MAKIIYVAVAILIFGILIALHELGHFLAAKLCGVRVNEFSIGMGPALWSRDRGETQYSLRLLPIGGYCAMEGEDGDSEDPGALSRQGFWKQFLILVSGALMNFLTGLVIIAVLFSNASEFYVDGIRGLAPEFQAVGEDGLMPGDRFYKVNGYRTYFYGDALTFLSYSGDLAEIEVVRDGRHIQVEAQRQDCTAQDGSKYRGFGIYTAAQAVPAAGQRLSFIWYRTIDYVQTVWFSLVQLVTGGASMDDVGGPVAIISTITEVGTDPDLSPTAAAAAANIASLAALIAVNLCVMNLLPIPALDGGRIFFLLLGTLSSKLFGKKIPEKYEAYLNTAFFVALMALMLVITLHDVYKLF